MSDKIFNKKVPKIANPDVAGTVINPGPYEAVVKGVLDMTRAGRLQVWVPELGSGDQNDVKNWYTVSYASPFAGATHLPDKLAKNKDNKFSVSRHTYGFWSVPPDIGNIVLVTFINGDPLRGYWFACTTDKIGFGMIPGIGGGPKDLIDTEMIEDPDLKKALTNESHWPLADFNENEGQNVIPQFYDVKRPPHEWQTKRYIKQGLDRDSQRGAKATSSQKNIPSAVFGWSTPGRPFKGDTADIAGAQGKVDRGDFTAEELEVIGRKGGHSFVMDDGDFFGKDQFIRLRTAAGHQILMDDSNRNLYVINSEGSCWIELAGSGQMHIFTSGGLNLRSKGDINMHSDKTIKMHAGDSIKMFAGKQIDINTTTLNSTTSDSTTIFGGTINIGSAGSFNMSAAGTGSWRTGGELRLSGSTIFLNSGPGAEVQKPEAIPKFQHDETQYNSSNTLWEVKSGVTPSITNILPTHEPWQRFGGTEQSAAVGGRTGIASGQQRGGGTGTAGGGTAGGGGGEAGTGRTAVNDAPAPEEASTDTTCVPGNVVRDGSGNPVKDGSGNFVTSGEEKLDPGPSSAAKQSLPSKKRVSKSYLTREDNPSPVGGIGPLNELNTKALFTALGYSESGFNYKAINPLNYVGKYQFGAAALATFGYIKMDYYKQYRNAAVKQAGAWTGKNGINSLEDWFNSPGAQEKAMYEYTQGNYKTMVNNGAIKSGDNLCTIAGLLCVAHLLGPSTGTEKNPGAKGWRQTGGGQDANGTTGALYFNLGRYAIDVLAATTG